MPGQLRSDFSLNCGNENSNLTARDLLVFSSYKRCLGDCPDTPSEAQVKHKMDRKLLWEERICVSPFVLHI